MPHRFLFTVKRQHFSFANEALEVVVDVDDVGRNGGSGEEEVACFEGEKLADVGNEVVDVVAHVARIARLQGRVVARKCEGEVVNGFEFVQRNPCAYGSTAIKALAQVPGLAGLL